MIGRSTFLTQGVYRERGAGEQNLTGRFLMVLGNEVEHFLLSRGLVVSALVSGSSGPRSSPGGPFLEAPGNYRAHKAVLFSILEGVSNGLKI